MSQREVGLVRLHADPTIIGITYQRAAGQRLGGDVQVTPLVHVAPEGSDGRVTEAGLGEGRVLSLLRLLHGGSPCAGQRRGKTWCLV